MRIRNSAPEIGNQVSIFVVLFSPFLAFWRLASVIEFGFCFGFIDWCAKTETLIKRWIGITFFHLIQNHRRNEAIEVPTDGSWSRQSDCSIFYSSLSIFFSYLACCSVPFPHFRCFKSSKSCKILLMNLWRDWEYSHLYKFNYFIWENSRNSQRLTFGIRCCFLFNIFRSVPSSSGFSLSLLSRLVCSARNPCESVLSLFFHFELCKHSDIIPSVHFCLSSSLRIYVTIFSYQQFDGCAQRPWFNRLAEARSTYRRSFVPQLLAAAARARESSTLRMEC